MENPTTALKIKAAITALITAGSALWGWTGWAIIALAACIILDYLSGTAAAMSKGEWSSTVARQGLWHKLGEIIALLVAILCDIAVKVILNTDALKDIVKFEWANIFTIMVSIWYILTELGSIIENAAALGAPVPKWMKNAIEKMKTEVEERAPMQTEQTDYDPDDYSDMRFR